MPGGFESAFYLKCSSICHALDPDTHFAEFIANDVILMALHSGIEMPDDALRQITSIYLDAVIDTTEVSINLCYSLDNERLLHEVPSSPARGWSDAVAEDFGAVLEGEQEGGGDDRGFRGRRREPGVGAQEPVQVGYRLQAPPGTDASSL